MWTQKRGMLKSAVVITMMLSASFAVADTMSRTQALGVASELRDGIADIVDEVRGLEEAALRPPADEARVIRCLTEKRQSLEGLLESADESVEALSDNATAVNDATIEHYVTMAEISEQSAVNLGIQARQCSGEAMTHTGGGERESRRDPRIPDTDTVSTGGGDDAIARVREVDEDPTTPDS